MTKTFFFFFLVNFFLAFFRIWDIVVGMICIFGAHFFQKKFPKNLGQNIFFGILSAKNFIRKIFVKICFFEKLSKNFLNFFFFENLGQKIFRKILVEKKFFRKILFENVFFPKF